MSDEPFLFRRYIGLEKEQKEKLASFMRCEPFKAGTLIAEPGRPVVGVYCVLSGVIAVSDELQADLGRRGILIERGDSFGEYSLMDKIRALPKPKEARDLPFRQYASDEKIRPFPTGLRALTDVETLFLPADQYPGAALVIDRAPRLVVERVFLNQRIAELVDALKRHPKLTTVAPYQLIDLAQHGQVIAVVAESGFQSAVDDPSPHDWLYLARGQLTVEGTSATMFPGSVFRWPGKKVDFVVPKGGETAWVVRIPKAELDDFAKHSFLVASCAWGPDKDPNGSSESSGPVRASGPDGEDVRAGAGARSAPIASKKIFLLSEGVPAQRRLPLSALTTLVANTLQRELPKSGDKDGNGNYVGLLVVRPKSEAVPGKLAELRKEAEAVGVVIKEADPEDVDAVKARLGELEAASDPVLIDCSREWMIGKMDDKELRPNKVAFIAHDPFAHVPKEFSDCQIIRCVVLRHSKVGEYLAYYPRTVRLAFDDIAQVGHKTYAKLSRGDLASLSRLGRAVTERRVGVALGGGGAWGFAHIALLQQLERVKMPIDMVSGVSFGSLAGGFYAAGGAPLLKAVMDNRQMLQWTLLLSSFVPPLVGVYLDNLLEAQRLEYLETTFLPVGLNLNTGEEWTPYLGTVASGIRAASSLPGFLSPYRAPGVRSVDGVYINNVPEGILIREGADFIIASDVAQVPKVPEAKDGWLQAVWNWTFVSRMQDSMRALAFTTKVSDERDSGLSNKRFRPEQTGVPPWDFSKGHLIKTIAEDRAAEFALDVRQQWATEWTRV